MAKAKSSTLHKYLFTVTPFSKLLALGLFIVFPIIAFYLGFWYGQLISFVK
jgi:cytochrome oxidase assembly protein ShyY1